MLWKVREIKVFSPHQGNIELGDLQKNWTIGHVMKIESDYYQRGQSLYSDIDKIIINLQDESNSDTSEDSQRLIAADR